MMVFHKVVTTLWLFLITETAACSLLKRFPEPRDIETATGPFVDDVLYVDKTSHILKLFHSGSEYFFVRPRRFGKSTFLRTLQAIFDGRGRRIFNGTHIHKSDYSWGSYPVLYMDFGNFVIESNETCKDLMKIPRNLTKLEEQVDKILTEFKTMHSLSKPKKTRFSDEFVSVLKEIRENGNWTVVLIDEYDFSILNNVQSCPPAVRINTVLVRNIFLQMKGYGHLMKFAFVTGISKAVFSNLHPPGDLEDITDTIEFHDIAGLTDSDLDKYYGDHFARVSKIAGKSKDTITSELKNWYNGYKFSEFAPSPLYNPWSVHNYLEKGSAKVYAGDKAYTQFLFEQMVKRPIQFRLNLKDGTRSGLQGGGSLNETEAALLLYDAGYITIHSFGHGTYLLKFPNLEMEEAYHNDIAEAQRISINSTDPEISDIRFALNKPKPDFHSFMTAINTILMKLPLRGLFEEWYNWQTCLHMRYAGISANRQTPIILLDGIHEKIVNVTGRTQNTHFLLEMKFNQRENSAAWRAAHESIEAFLVQNKKETQPLNLLAAGITFTDRLNKDPVLTYQAKLYASNGTVLEEYESHNLENSNRDGLFYTAHNFKI